MRRWIVISCLIGLALFVIGSIGMFYGAHRGHGPNWGFTIILAVFPIFEYGSSVLHWLPENNGVVLLIAYTCMAILQFVAIGAAACWTKEKIKIGAEYKRAGVLSAALGLLVFVTLLFFNPSSSGFWKWGIFPPVLFPLFPDAFPTLSLTARVMVRGHLEYIWEILAYAGLAMAQFIFYGTVFRWFLRRYLHAGNTK